LNLKTQGRSNRHSSDFVDSVLKLKPRTAAFDCDGTLWAGDAGETFFSWELDQKLVSDEIISWARSRYAAYRLGKVSEEDMCGEMVFMHYGLSEKLVQSAANQYFDEVLASQIFVEMRELVQKLMEQGCDVWAVSSTNEWMIRAAMRHFGIPDSRILASAVEIANGTITDHLIRVPSGAGKTKAMQAATNQALDAAFGNSKWDVELLTSAAHAYAVNPNPDLESLARKRGWRIYFPDAISG
jgi:HAD superfamily phosphoserine phosphatase-like hydrolase